MAGWYHSPHALVQTYNLRRRLLISVFSYPPMPKILSQLVPIECLAQCHTIASPAAGEQNSGHHPSHLTLHSKLLLEILPSSPSPLPLHKCILLFPLMFLLPAQISSCPLNLLFTHFLFLEPLMLLFLAFLCVPFAAWNVSCPINFWPHFKAQLRGH